VQSKRKFSWCKLDALAARKAAEINDTTLVRWRRPSAIRPEHHAFADLGDFFWRNPECRDIDPWVAPPIDEAPLWVESNIADLTSANAPPCTIVDELLEDVSSGDCEGPRSRSANS
jgi:hypothetical protein